MKIITNRILKYFLRGILLTLPLGGTVWLVIVSLSWLNGRLNEMLNLHIPGLGIVIILVGVTLIGFLGSGLLLRPVLDILDDLLESVPGIKIIYSSIKDFLGAFVGEKRKFKQPVAVEMSTGIYKMGFVTQTDLSNISFEGFVAVYFPHSYNFSGNVFLVPADKVKNIKGNPSDVMKFIVTGGVTDIEDEKKDVTSTGG